MLEKFITIFNESAAPDGSVIVNQLFPNLWVFIAHIVATLIIIGAIIWFAWKPTKEFLKKRKDVIEKNVVESKEARIEANKNLEISKQELLDSKQTAREIINNATLEADELRKDIEKKAKNRAAFIEKEATENIKKQENELNKKINSQVFDLAFDTAEVLLGKKINKTENKDLVDSIIKDLESTKLKEE